MPTNSRRQVRNVAAHGERAVKSVQREVTAAGREALNGMTDQMHEAFDAGRTQITDLAECARDTIRERPLRSLAMAIGAGVVFGLIMRFTNRWR